MTVFLFFYARIKHSVQKTVVDKMGGFWYNKDNEQATHQAGVVSTRPKKEEV